MVNDPNEHETWLVEVSIAVNKARELLREQGIDPATVDYNRALAALDALYDTDPGHAAARWYREASQEAYQRFARNWSRYGRKKRKPKT